MSPNVDPGAAAGGRSPQDRVWAALPAGAKPVLRTGLSPTDLQTLLLDLVRGRAAVVTPARLMQRWRQDRFVRPAGSDPRRLAAVEAALWSALPDRFAGVELSPVTPLGSVSAMSSVGQNRVLATVRGSEVVSDPTNALAIEAAVRRSSRADSAAERVDLAAAHRVLRTQVFTGSREYPHFKLFALVSSGRDRGSGLVEAQFIVDHLRFYAAAISAIAPTMAAELVVSTFRRSAIDERLDELLPALEEFARIAVRRDRDRTHGRGYYTSHALGINLGTGDGSADLGDGGLTDWTARLLGDAKERCLTSCISIERLAAAVG
jgi:hypothetical protein